MAILLLEDDPYIARAVIPALEEAGFRVAHEVNGLAGLARLERLKCDAVLLDLGLPGLDGMEVLRRIRAMQSPLSRVPILIISARDAITARLEGLDQGADDYILKPFHVSELLARLRAVMRRKEPEKREVLETQDLTVNIATATVTLRGEVVSLTRREYELLKILMLHPGSIFSRTSLIHKLYSPGDEPEGKAIEFLIHGLRKKLGNETIENIRGLGWRVKAY